jgi:NAD(P)-dependent dehydrogenase (short-subunit alcohol dehydrogenase family)
VTDVLITGASRGIGYALTREYLARGARVFAAVRDPDSAPKLRSLSADNLVVVPLDVRSDQDIAAAGDLVGSFGGLDRLINNAGVGDTSSGLAEVDGAQMRDLLNINTVAPLLIAQRFLPLLRPDARLVNITMPTGSIARLSRTENHAFIASRYAHNALTKMIAAELAGTGRIVVAMWPGYLRTDLNDYADAATPLDDAIPGVVEVIERLRPTDHGECLMPDGTHFSW